MKKILIILISITFLIALFSCKSNDLNEYGVIFGTTYDIQLEGGDVNSAYEDIMLLLEDIEGQLSTSVEESDVYRINNSTPNTPVEVGALAINMYKRGQTLYEETQGAFNIAIYPLVELWGFSPSEIESIQQPPSQQEIQDILHYCDIDYFELNDENNTITRLSEYAKLDFGAIAKGYAVQEAINICNQYEIENALVNIGGNVGIIGKTIKVGIKSPRPSNSNVFGAFDMVSGESVATSGDYEKFYIYEDVRYHHIIDTITGAPVNNGIIGVSIICEDAIITDALSTAVFALGVVDGMQFAEDNNVKCLIIMDDDTYYVSDGFDLDLRAEGYNKGTYDEAS